MSKALVTKPITIKNANLFVGENHRHHRPTTRNSGKWAISAVNEFGYIVGVAIAGNPVSATYMDGETIEVTRLCTLGDAPKGTCSFLLGKVFKIWKEMGGCRAITYTLSSESGASLRGAGWVLSGIVKPHNGWERKSTKDGKVREKLEIYTLEKTRWEKTLLEAS